MRYDIRLAPEAMEDLNRLRAHDRAAVRAALEKFLRHAPTTSSKSRIKRLRGLVRPEYRLRVGDEIRVFYDVTETQVQVLAIVPKADAESWLERYGESDEEGGAV